MDTQRNEVFICSKCNSTMELDKFGRPHCQKCSKNTQPKTLYEEAFFDLKDYQN